MVRLPWLLLVVACGRVDFDPVAADADCTRFALADREVNLSSYAALQATGGLAPVTYTLAGPGMLQGDTFVAPAYRAVSQVTAQDAAGCTATATLTTAGNLLFWIGGTYNAAPTAEVWQGTNALAWTKIGSLPAVRINGAAAVFHDALWYIGGSVDLSVNGHTDVWRSTDGVTWAAAGAFPVPITDCAAIAFHDKLWVIGGHGNPGGVWSSSDGVAWTRVAELPSPVHGGELVVLGDRLVYMGGHDDTSYYDNEWASSDGVTWTDIGTLPSRREFQATTIHDGTVMFAGGTDAGGTIGDSYHSPDGVSWIPGGALPQPRLYAQLHWVGDRYYLVGGTDGGDVWSTIDGTSWAIESSGLPHPRDAGALLEFTPP